MTTAVQYLDNVLKTLEKCQGLLAKQDQPEVFNLIDDAHGEVQCAKELLQEATRKIGG